MGEKIPAKQDLPGVARKTVHAFDEICLGAPIPCSIYFIIDSLAENITKRLLIPNQYDILELACLHLLSTIT